ncbi:hypothetical protein FS749_015712 [Ceratobasidium sp. UAMH 11750]|nr:hypothetical protein FS749_015712 [Ceratobasidium sp. UAMH 11750]
MPTLPLARSLLPLIETFRGTEASMFECAPWTEAVFRHNLGLAPLSSEDLEDDFDYDSPSNTLSSPAAGFVLAPTTLASLPPATVKNLSDTSFLRASSFVDNYLRVRTLRGIDQKRAADWVMARLDLRERKTMKKQGGEEHFWADYRDVVLALLKRPGGILSIVADVMARHRATPVEALRDRREEFRRRPTSSVDECDISTPPPGQYLESAELRNEVARLVFGDCAVNSRGIVNSEYRKSVSCFLSRVWESLFRKLEVLKKRSKRQREELDAQLEEAKRLRTPRSLQAAGRKLKDWRATAQQTLEYDEPDFQDREADLNELWEEMGYVDEAAKKPRRKRKAKAKGAGPGPVLPEEAEMTAAFQYYMEEYCNSLCSDPDALVPPPLEFNPIDLTADETDIGVDRFKDWPTEKTWANLGLPGATQFPFAEPGAPPRKPGEAARAKILPKWHQIVGVNAILEGAFTKDLGDCSRPTLLCDDVGLGKTLQIIGVISMLAHLREQQKRGEAERLPPPAFTIEMEKPYFAGLKEVPNLPTLIAVPRTLARQWLDQLETFTQKGSFIILHFSNDHKPIDQYFSDPNGPFRKAMGPNGENASKIIVVAEFSALASEVTRCLLPPSSTLRGQAAKLKQAEGQVPKFRTGLDVSKTIFGIKWNMLALDEIHNLRNSCLTYLASLALAENSHLRIGATATPIFTGPKDLASQGRVLRYEPMIGDNGRKLFEQMMDSQRDRTREWEDDSKIIVEATIQAEAELVASKSGWSEDDPRVESTIEALRQKYSSDDQMELLKRVFIARGPINMIREVMLEIVVRRTGSSKDADGRPVLDLMPYKTGVVYSPLSPVEAEEVARVNDEHLRAKKLRDADECEGSIIKWTNFLFDQKNAAMDHRIAKIMQQEIDENLKKYKLADKMADDWNASNIHEKASTRVQKVGEIVDHFWSGNPKVPVYRPDGTRDHAAEEKMDDPAPSDRPRKFLIYVAYRLHRILVKKFLEVKGRGFVEYDGTMTARKRDAAVKKFTTDDNCRIMLISNVGSAGLNLTAASIIILVSGVWSGLERAQIIGRAWRYGQLRDVVVLDIIAPGTIDLALAGYANGKTMMLDSFLAAKQALHRAHTIITSTTVDSEDEDEAEAAYEADCATQNDAKPSKVADRVRKRRVIDSDDEANSNEASQLPSKPAKRARATGSKVKAAPASQPTGEEGGASSNASSQSGSSSTVGPAESKVATKRGHGEPGSSEQPKKVGDFRMDALRLSDTQLILAQASAARKTQATSVVAPAPQPPPPPAQASQPQAQQRRLARPKLRAPPTADLGESAVDAGLDMFDLSRMRVASSPESTSQDQRCARSSPSDGNARLSGEPAVSPARTMGSGPTPHAAPIQSTEYSEEERQLARSLGIGSPRANPKPSIPAGKPGAAVHQPRVVGRASRISGPKPAPTTAKDAREPTTATSSSVERASVRPGSSLPPPQSSSSQPSQPTKKRTGFAPAVRKAAPPPPVNSRDRALAMELDEQDAKAQMLARPRSPTRAQPLRLSANRASGASRAK